MMFLETYICDILKQKGITNKFPDVTKIIKGLPHLYFDAYKRLDSILRSLAIDPQILTEDLSD